LSDQTEKPKGALPKGYDADTPSVENTSSTETVRHKKINFKKLFSVTPTDQDQREKDLQEYESSYLARIEKKAGPRSEESSDSFLVDLVEDEEPQEDLGKLNLSKHAVNKRKKLQEERAEYEQKYLSKYKEPKGKPRKKGLSKIYKPETKVKVDRKKVRREYERKFLTRIKKEKTKSSKTGASKLYRLEQKVKRDMNKERAEYEKKFLARYKEPKGKSKKSSISKYDDDLGRLDIRKHSVVKRKEYLANRKDYEAKYIQRYMSKQKPKTKKTSGKKIDHDLISGRLNLREFVDKKRKELHVERNVYEKKYLARYKQANAKAAKSGSGSVSDDELGRLNFRKHTVAKRKEYLAERAAYEQKYIARYNKQKKPGSKKRSSDSSLYKPEPPKPKRDMKKERADYEKKYLARYKEPKSKSKKSSISKYDDDLGRLDIRKHSVVKRKEYLANRADYEKKFLARYKQVKIKSSRKGISSLYKPEPPKPKRDMKKERTDYEKKYLARYQTKQKTNRKKKK